MGQMSVILVSVVSLIGISLGGNKMLEMLRSMHLVRRFLLVLVAALVFIITLSVLRHAFHLQTFK